MQEAPTASSVRTIAENGGRMDGFVKALERIGNGCQRQPDVFQCREATRAPGGQPDIMGYHTASEIPNYWAYAKHFVLQDHMFAPESLVDPSLTPVPGVGAGRRHVPTSMTR